MYDHITFLLLGLGTGAVYAALAIGLVTTYRSSGVINFGTGAVALYSAYNFAYLREGQLFSPLPGTPVAVTIGDPLGILPALLLSTAMAAMLGALQYVCVFRPLRAASPVAKAVASIGLMLFIQSLLAARLGMNPAIMSNVLPSRTVTIGAAHVSTDRLWFAVVVVAAGVALGALIAFTRFGLATRAVAESERGALVSGLSPDTIAVANWALSSAVAGVAGVLIAPIVQPSPAGYTLFVVPALAAALVGRLTRLAPAIVAGLVIGMLQSEAANLQVTVPHFPAAGVDTLIPLALILGVLMFRQGGLPQRDAVAQHSLGRAPLPRSVPFNLIVGLGVGVVSIMLTSGNWRASVITSMILAIFALSQVVVTGYTGQVSLAQLSLGGSSAFLLAELAGPMGVPFPFAPLLAALGAAALGVVIGLPALRLQGISVAAVTLSFAAAAEMFWFNNPDLNGGLAGQTVAQPTLFGIDLGIGSGLAYPRPAFGLLVLGVLSLVALAVAMLRRSRLGAAMLAVRANERSAAASGINVARTKITAFALGSFIAGLGGAMLAYQQQAATAASFTALGGVALFAAVYLAGVSSVLGGLAAGVLAAGGIASFTLAHWVELDQYFAVLSGLLLLVTVIQFPEGMTGPIHDVLHRVRMRRRNDVPAAAGRVVTARPDAPTHRSDPAGAIVLEVENVRVTYGGVTAVDDVSFVARRGEILGIIGPNGAGKTTLLDAISGFVPRAAGSVVLNGSDLAGLRPHERVRKGLGRTFQSIELYDDLTVEENVRVGTMGTDIRNAAGRDGLHQIFNALDLANVRSRPVSELSQGQRQLVSVARALAGRPEALLLDEPAAGLDSHESAWLGMRLEAIREAGTSIVMIDHDMGLVLKTCDRVVVLDRGRKIADGPPEEIRQDPAVIAAYLGAVHAADDAPQGRMPGSTVLTSEVQS